MAREIGITVQPRQMTDIERKAWDLFEKNGVNPYRIRSETVRIEFTDGFGAVLIGEAFIPVDAEDFAPTQEQPESRFRPPQ